MKPACPILLALMVTVVLKVNAAMMPLAWRCDYHVNPAGMDEAQPRGTWRVESSERGQTQTACQILVAASAELLQANNGDLWDRGGYPTSKR